MRRRVVLGVALALLLASMPAMALPTPSPNPFLSRAPIAISDDTQFTAANGVVAGTGSPGDPFVISGWSITTANIGIKVTNVAKSFIIRDNAIDAGTGIHVTQVASVNATILNNKLIVHATGIYVANANATVRDNSLIGYSSTFGAGRGVDLLNSNSIVESNAFLYVQYAVYAERGSPRILCNDMHDDVVVAGITVRYTTNATIDCNILTRCNAAIQSIASIGTVIVNNTIDDCGIGIQITLTKDFNATNNTVRASWYDQVRIDTSVGIFSGNLILDGTVNGVVVFRSPVVFANNTITNHLRVGVIIDDSSGNYTANVILYNNVGLTMRGGAVPHLVANVFINNTVGIDIPYSSRQAIVNLSANIVNGVNIDGTITASEKVYFYHAANVTITGQVRDSGFSAGFFGSLTAQGNIVLYDVDTANINASVVSHANIGLGVINSFNVNVNGSLFISNLIGISVSANATAGQVPNCVVSVKDTNITLPQDPIATIGIDVHGCLAIVGNVTISIVDTGVKIDGQAALIMFNTTISQTKLALDLQGSPHNVNLTGNVIIGNLAGARLAGTIGLVANNTFYDNDLYGLRLERGANITLKGNNLSANGIGLVDAQTCGALLTCSSVTARDNVFFANLDDGARVGGTSSWTGDIAIGNGGDGFELGKSARLRGVLAAGNEGDGARIIGTFSVEDSVFTHNDEDGLELVGAGELRDSNFTFNENAGIRASGSFIASLHLNVSFNLDGIVISTGGAVAAPTNTPGLLALVSGSGGPAPFDIHLSTLMGNERDAIRAGNSLVNATHNWWGTPNGPAIEVADTIGAFQNGVTPGVRFIPFFVDPARTTTGPVAGL